MLTATYLSLLFLYSLAICLLYYWWRKIENPAEGNLILEKPYISIVIVIRNEEANIQALLSDLQQQKYPASAFEIIVVDDHSTDASCAMVEQLKVLSPVPLRLLSLKDAVGKKAGLALGVHEAKGEVVVVTDGDCRIPENWLRSYAQSFSTQEAQFISGPVSFLKSNSLFAKLQTIEFASLVGSGAALLQAGFPGMCNAANMAFRKKAYLEAETARTDFHIPSGDDEFLLQAIYNKYPEQVYFLKTGKAVVQTAAQNKWSSFVQQRKRWAGKWRLQRKPAVALSAISLFLFYILWLAMQLTLMLKGEWLLFFGGALLKFSLELLFLRAVLGLMDKGLPILPFIILQLIYPLYVIYFGIVVNFGSFSWKGRTYKYASV